FLPLDDHERAEREIEEGLKLGCGTFWIPLFRPLANRQAIRISTMFGGGCKKPMFLLCCTLAPDSCREWAPDPCRTSIVTTAVTRKLDGWGAPRTSIPRTS